MKKIFFCVSLALAGLMSSCVEKYEEVDAESKPEWLGSSIYAELSSPSAAGGLQGTFNTYLRLISDLGQADVLSRTGSKTVFPANDEAFARFFAGKNDWDVHKYEDLSYAQKVLLLKSSMLDNPLLIQMLPNMSNGSVEASSGQAVKHQTNVSITDTIQLMNGKADMPANNPFWEPYYNQQLDVVSDASRPMMVHLTREYMINKGITFRNANSDFELITGSPYPEGSNVAYIFNNKVVVSDVTCQNGYIHQMEDVLVPPGNMAELLRNRGRLETDKKHSTKYMSRMLDYFSVPILSNAVTSDYNAWARDNKKTEKTGIYTRRYLSSRSYNYDDYVDGKLWIEQLCNKRVEGRMVTNYLDFDPGWNGYFPHVASPAGRDTTVMEIAAIFAPTDQAVEDYFLPGNGDPNKGHGAFLIDIYGNKENTSENLAENLDSLFNKNPQVITQLLKNLMKSEFSASVPSKFESVLNDASEVMGLEIGLISKKDNGKHDIVLANNGAVYMMDRLLPPDAFQAVLAPAMYYQDMKVMNWAVQDRGSGSYHLGLDFQFYLLAMKANYAFFIPEDAAYDFYYLDPASLGHREGNNASGAPRPYILHFFYNEDGNAPALKCERARFDMETGQVVGDYSAVSIANVTSQLIDMLNYHTVVLKEGQDISSHHYFKTKHGGEIYVDGPNAVGTHAMSGAQLDHQYYDDMANQQKGRTFQIQGFDAPTIKTVYAEKNGHAYRIDRVIQAPTQSVYAVLKGNDVFSEFLNVCNGFEESVMEWAGISSAEREIGGKEQDAYVVFTSDYKMGTTEVKDACLDKNVKMFNTYNYTLFAPDNDAMQKAYSQGLPKWESSDPSEETIGKLFQDYEAKVEAWAQEHDEDPKNYQDDAEDIANKAKGLAMINALRDFVRYHFITNSVYADEIVDGSNHAKTLSSDDMGVAKEIKVSGGGGILTVQDAYHTVNVNAADRGTKVINKMTRDYWFNRPKLFATAIETSSFCAVHQISDPLCSEANGKYNNHIPASRRSR